MKAEAPTVLARCQHRSRTYFAIIWDWNGLPAIVQRSILPPPQSPRHVSRQPVKLSHVLN